MAHEVRGDPEEPGSGVGPGKVIPVADVKRGGEGLGSEIVGKIRADPATKVAVDDVVVSVEDGRERERLIS